MLRKTALAAVLAAASVALAVAAPANASVPSGGKGLEDFGEFQCEGLGTISIFGPAGGPIGFTTSGLQLIARSFSGSFTDEEGNVVPFEATFGTKAGLGPFHTCSQVFEGGSITLSVAVVPPGS